MHCLGVWKSWRPKSIGSGVDKATAVYGRALSLCSMDLSSAIPIATMVGTVLKGLKDAKDLAKESDDLDLKEKINDAYSGLLELSNRLYEVADENRQLKTALEEQVKYTDARPPYGYFYRTDDTEFKHPLCPRCFQNRPRRIGVLGESRKASGGFFRHCTVCSGNLHEA